MGPSAHGAALCGAGGRGGGVDGFLIGSELPGVTTVRSGASTYPAVAQLVALAAEVKALLPEAAVSYAADWTEWSGHTGRRTAAETCISTSIRSASADVAFIGIDNYAPLADWRDGVVHADHGLSPSGRGDDTAYLQANVEGGEGFAWYYASDVDRAAQARTPLADIAYGKDWVFRVKDIRSWWANVHHDRPGGVEAAVPTARLPQAKPVRFTEIGCPAVDKGANQPTRSIRARRRARCRIFRAACATI